MDADGDARAVRLVALHTVDVDNPLLPVDLGNLALTALVLAANDPDLVVFPDRDGAGIVFGAELLGERGGHDLAADGGRCREVRLARLAPGGGDVYAD